METFPRPNADDPIRNSGSILKQLKEIDDKRPDFPGEHLIVFSVGALLMLAGLRSRKAMRGVLLTTAGSALVGRAASGTGGVSRLARIVKKLG